MTELVILKRPPVALPHPVAAQAVHRSHALDKVENRAALERALS